MMVSGGLKGNLKDAETMVRHILAHYPNARSDDKLLLLYYWRIADGIDIPPEVWRQIMTQATTPETISRIRRLIQAKGQYSARNEVKETREKHRQMMLVWSQQGKL